MMPRRDRALLASAEIVSRIDRLLVSGRLRVATGEDPMVVASDLVIGADPRLVVGAAVLALAQALDQAGDATPLAGRSGDASVN